MANTAATGEAGSVKITLLLLPVLLEIVLPILLLV